MNNSKSMKATTPAGKYSSEIGLYSFIFQMMREQIKVMAAKANRVVYILHIMPSLGAKIHA